MSNSNSIGGPFEERPFRNFTNKWKQIELCLLAVTMKGNILSARIPSCQI